MRGGRFPDNEVSPCDECMERDGHYCPGIIPVDGGKRHLCTACDDGVACGRSKATGAPGAEVVEVDESDDEPEPGPNPLADVPEPSRAELIIEQHEERTARASLRAAKALKGRGRAPRVNVRRRSVQEQAARENPAGPLLMRLHGELVDLEARAAETKQLIVLLERQSRRWEGQA